MVYAVTIPSTRVRTGLGRPPQLVHPYTNLFSNMILVVMAPPDKKQKYNIYQIAIYGGGRLVFRTKLKVNFIEYQQQQQQWCCQQKLGLLFFGYRHIEYGVYHIRQWGLHRMIDAKFDFLVSLSLSPALFSMSACVVAAFVFHFATSHVLLLGPISWQKVVYNKVIQTWNYMFGR
jgi:hypothetical protein